MTCYATWSAALLTIPLLGSLPSDWGHAGSAATAAAVFLGIGPSAVAFATWAYAVHRLGVSTAATSLYLAPVVALPATATWLGEVLRPVEPVGGGVAVVGVLIANSSRAGQSTLAPAAAASATTSGE